MTEQNKNNWRIYLVFAIKTVLHILIITLFAGYLAESKIYLDAERIYKFYCKICDNFTAFGPFDAFVNIARFYFILFLGRKMSKTVFFIMCGIVWIGIEYLIVRSIRIKNVKWYAVFAILCIFDAIYMCQPAKEHVMLLVCLFALKMFRSKCRYKYVILIAGIGLYALFFRNYMFVFAIIFGLIHLFRRKPKTAVIVTTAGLIAFVVLYQMGKFQFLVEARILPGTANSEISEIFPRKAIEGNVLLFLVNYIVSLFRIIVPVELFGVSLSRAAMFVPVQAALAYLYYLTIKGLREKEDEVTRNCLYFMAAQLLTAALFEPDFGSVLRHMCGYLPIYMYLIFEAYKGKNFYFFRDKNIA